MAHITVTSEYHYSQQIASGHHRLTADEPIARGGSDSGASPYELLLASLGACTSITLRMYAGRKDWELGKITVGLRYTAAEDQKGHIDRRLSFSKPLTA
jgi:putative redox protein